MPNPFILFISILQMALGIGYFLAFDNVRTATPNHYPAIFFSLLPAGNLIGACLYFFLPPFLLLCYEKFIIARNIKWRNSLLTGAVIQFILLVYSSVGSVIAVIQGTYLDGTVIPRWHIWSDQNIYIILPICQAYTIVYMIRQFEACSFCPVFNRSLREK